eukprot:PITA_23695
MKKDILTFVAECDVCQRHKGEIVKSLGTLQPLPISASIWMKVSMDFITSLPKSSKKSVIMVVVDKLYKYAHFCTLPHPFTPDLVAQSFMDQIFKLHGMPTSIVSDHDPIFTSNFWLELFRLQERKFQEGDQVFLTLQPYKQTSLKDKGCQKLSPKFYGPYQVLQHIREVAYMLALPPTTKIHPVFHVSCLKKVIGNHCRIQTNLPELDEEVSIWLQPEQVLDKHKRHLRDRMIKEVIVKWKDTSPEDATWEPATVLQQFLQLQP